MVLDFFAQGRLKAAVVVCCIVINIDFPFLAACMAAGTSLAMEIIETLGQDGNHGIHLECVGSFYYTSLPPFGGEKTLFSCKNGRSCQRKKQKIEIQSQNDEFTVVKDGLDKQDIIIRYPSDKMNEGDAIPVDTLGIDTEGMQSE